MRWNVRDREDIDELGIADADAISNAADVYENEAYHWTRTKQARDSILKNGLGLPKQFMLDDHEGADAYRELPDSVRSRLLKKYGSPYSVVSDGILDVEKAFKRANPSYSRVWVAADPLTSQGYPAARDYGPYGVRIRLADWISDTDPWGTLMEDFAYGHGLTFEGPIPPEYLEPVDLVMP